MYRPGFIGGYGLSSEGRLKENWGFSEYVVVTPEPIEERAKNIDPRSQFKAMNPAVMQCRGGARDVV